MLALPPERLEEALGVLEPTHRALLELSLHREVADPALAELLRTDVDAVTRQRADALEQLGTELEAPPEEVEDALIGLWRGPGDAAEAEPEEPEAEAEAEPEEVSERDEELAAAEPASIGALDSAVEPRRSSRRRLLWIGLLAVVGVVVLVVALSGGDDEEPANDNAREPAPAQPAPEQPEPEPEQPEPGGGQRVEMESVLGGSEVSGTAQIVESGGKQQLELKLSGLAEGGYAVWLYNSISDARLLTPVKGPAETVRAPLPDGYERFQYVDVSREPDDGNPNHSGESVLRVPTADLAGG